MRVTSLGLVIVNIYIINLKTMISTVYIIIYVATSEQVELHFMYLLTAGVKKKVYDVIYVCVPNVKVIMRKKN